MSSFSDWDEDAKAGAEANWFNKSAIFDALEKTAVTRVTVGFDGEGDQGQMDRASAQSNGNAVEFPKVTLTVRVPGRFGEDRLRELSLQDAVEKFCYGYLEVCHGGWENNDGSFGEFVLDVAARTITLNYYWRTTHAEHSTFTV